MTRRVRSAAALGIAVLLGSCGRGVEGPAVPRGAEAVQQAGAAAAKSFAATRPPTRMPALGNVLLADMAADAPALRAQLPALEAGELEAIEHVMNDARARLLPPQATPTARRLSIPFPSRVHSSGTMRARSDAGSIPVLDWFIAPAAAADSGIGWGSLQSALAGYMVTSFFGGVADAGHGTAGQEQLRSEYAAKTGEKASIVVRTEADNQVTSELSTDIAVPLFLIEANSKVSITSRGLCPDAGGSVEFTIHFNSGGHRNAGQAMTFDRTREAHVKVTVNDDAEIASADIETKYADRATSGGRASVVEGATKWTATGSRADDINATVHDVVHAASNASEERTFTEAMTQALLLGQSALLGAKSHWQDGSCIRINATSPGRVKRKAVTPIPVDVTHRPDGEPVTAKVQLELTGGQSVAPMLLPRTPGTITHTAPDTRVAQISIKLTARSKRGMAEETLKLLVNESAFQAEGGADEFHGTGLICSLGAPFEISDGNFTAKFVPASEQGGTYSYSGNVAGFHLFGKGTYKVIYEGETPVEIFATGPGNAETARSEGDEHYKLTPAEDYRCDNLLKQ